MNRTDLTWLFLRFSGRISRRVYFLGGLLVTVVQAFFLYRFTLEPLGTMASDRWAVSFWAIFVLSQWVNVAMAVKRLHDFDRPGIFAVIVPFFFLFAFIFLCIVPGTPGPNRYGSSPDRPE